MAVATSTLLGRPVWYELMTTDMKAAESFYKTVVGWTTEPFEGAGQPYTALNRSGNVGVGGIMTRPAEVKAPPFWAMYVAVPKLEDAVAHITRLGGKTHTDVIAIPSVGRMQMMMDPQGAAFYIIEPASSSSGPKAAPEVGDASWHELMTTDMDAALKFYQEVFGWQLGQTMDMGPMGKYQMFNRPHGQDDRRHDEQADGDGQRPAQLADLLPRARRRRGRRAHQGRRREDPQRTDGRAGR